MKNRATITCALMMSCLAAIGAVRSEWPQFRGRNASGLETNRASPVRWDVAQRENIAWTTPVPGLSHASPIVWGDKVFVATAVGPGIADLKVGLYGDIEPLQEAAPHEWRVLCLDRDSGKVIWNVVAHQGVPRSLRHPKATHCNSTPATDGNYLAALLGSEGLFCLNLDGKLLWRKDLGAMDAGYFAVPSAQWGFGSSPVIRDGKVVVLCDVQTNSFLACFDLESGRENWRVPRGDVPTWGTPTIVESGSRVQVVVNGWKHIGGYDFASGKELWRLREGGDIPVPTPIFEHGLIYLTSAHGKLRPMRAVRPDATGDITPPEPGGTNASIVWNHPRQGSYMQTPIAVKDLVFGCTDNGVLTCFDAKTGKIEFSERLPGGAQGYTASPVSDGRHLYFTGESGRVVVVPVQNQFSCVATNTMGETCMATPAIADGKLLFRTRNNLIAVGSAR